MLIKIFDGIKDPRKIDVCTYELGDLLAIALLTYLTGRKDYKDMALFAKYRSREFGLLHYTEESPSNDTFERVIGAIGRDFMEECVVKHGNKIMDSMNEKHIALDGKKQRGTAPRLGDEKGDYQLNAWATENSIILGQEKVKDKENEIPAYPRLLDKLFIKGATVSIDAMGTQVDIAQKIIDKGGHYFLAVKENQGSLLAECKDVIKYNKPVSEHSETDKEHARVETRKVSIYDASLMEDKDILNRWPSLKTIVCVQTQTVHVSEGGRTEQAIRYYISDDDFHLAKYFGEVARAHWAIENKLHWHLDVTLGEDDCRARKNNASENLSMLRKLALQILTNADDNLSMQKRMVRASLDSDYLTGLLKKYGF